MARSLGLGVLAWGRLGTGVLSSKYARPAGQGRQRRLAEMDPGRLAIARAVADVVDGPRAQFLGRRPRVAASPKAASSRSSGARTSQQLADNLTCLDTELPPEALARLDQASHVNPRVPPRLPRRSRLHPRRHGRPARPPARPVTHFPCRQPGRCSSTVPVMRRFGTHGHHATPLAEAAFRRIWLASMLSAAGDTASWVALAVLILRMGGSLPLLAVLYTAPVAVGGLAAGWALDRFDRRHLLAVDATVRGAVFAAIPLAAVAGSVGSAQVYATAACYGLLMMISLAGFPAMIPQLVGADLLPAANALEAAGFGVATVAGPALAGAMLGAGLHPAVVIAADAATYFVFAAALLLTPGPVPLRRLQPVTRSRPAPRYGR